MKYFLLKFNHGVEIGAHLAYLGHYRRTNDPKVLEIANDEVDHRKRLEFVMEQHDLMPSKIIDTTFMVIGTLVYWACQISPRFTLNYVARTLEMFAVFNYTKMEPMYEHYGFIFREMAAKEREHEEYFR